MQNKIEAVIWDMGGVLIRTIEPSFRRDLSKWLNMSEAELYALVFESESARRATLGLISEQEHWNILQGRLGLNNEDMQDFRAAFWAGDDLDRQLYDYIGSLRACFRTGLLSNAWSGVRQMMSSAYDLLSVFDVSIFSAEVGLAKPDPAIYHRMLEMFNLPPEKAVFIDDVKVNVESARQVGIHGIVFQNRQQALEELALFLEI